MNDELKQKQFKIHFAETLKSARKAAGVTQEQLAAELDVDRSLIAKYESAAAMPNAANIPKICRLLNLTAEELFEM